MCTAAFFDVDETLVSVKTIFRFLAYHLAARGRPPEDYHRARQRLRAMSEQGTSRAETLAAYFELFAGEDAAVVAGDGTRWFAAELARGGLFNEPVLDRLRRHAAADELTVLVSGSFPACLDPIAEFVGPDLVLCSRPQIVDGRYTGAIAVPMIGAAKADAVRHIAAVRGISLGASFAYGDHASDLPLLELVGNPVVVGDDATLAARADQHGWSRLALRGSNVRAG
jgi:HAD superfamily hydrolase (TIGR01490 family)